MKKNIIIYFLLNTLFVMAQAPAIAWQKRYGGNSNDDPAAMQKTADGGFIIVGTSESDASCNKTEDAFSELDYWVIKLDSTGALQWQRTLGGGYALIPEPNPILVGIDMATSVVQSADGGYLIGGNSQSEPSGNKTALKYGETDVWVIKLDGNGNTLWEKSFGGVGNDFLDNIITTPDNGFILCSNSNSDITGNKTVSSRGGADIWLIKIDSNGVEQFQKAIGGSSVDRGKIEKTLDGGYIIAAVSGSPISGEKTVANYGGSNTWIIKFDALLNIVWQKVFGSASANGYDHANDILILPDGGYLFGGNSSTGISGNKTVATHGSADYWLIRTDSNGNDIWQKSIGGNALDVFGSLGQYSNGSFLVTGYSQSPISGDKTHAMIGIEDAWMVKINSAGTILWDKSISGLNENNLNYIQILSDDSVVLTGKVRSSVFADVTLAGCNSVDYWIVKLQAENLSISQNSYSSTKIYPNPFENFINIDFQNTKENINISFINSLGQIIKNKKFYNTLNIRLNTEDFSSGIYFLKIETDDNQSEIFKIIKH